VGPWGLVDQWEDRWALEDLWAPWDLADLWEVQWVLEDQ